MVDEVWLVRHGVTSDNQRGIVQGHTDTPLSAAGEAQARRLGAHLVTLGVDFTAFESSDLTRALRTAELIGEPLELDAPVVDACWREASYGQLEGRPGAALRPYRELPEAEAAETAPPGGESPLAMQRRVVAALAARTAERSSEQDGRLLLVTHGGPIAALVCEVLGLPFGPRAARRFRRDNTGVTILRRSGSEAGAWRLATLNAVQHLKL